MELTPLQEIFILLEDEKEVPLYRLNRWGRQSRGVLAKLKKFGWAEKRIGQLETFYKITNKGEKEIDRTLKPLKNNGEWDGKWRLIIFNLPETQRDLRDRLRRHLTKLGLGTLQNSVWITPNNIKEEIDQIATQLKLENNLKYFEVTRNNSIDQNIIEKSWNLPELEDDYKRYNLESERALKSIEKNNNSRFAIKKLIFQYALILQKDPILPWEFREKDPLRKKAHDNYLALRSHLT